MVIPSHRFYKQKQNLVRHIKKACLGKGDLQIEEQHSGVPQKMAEPPYEDFNKLLSPLVVSQQPLSSFIVSQPRNVVQSNSPLANGGSRIISELNSVKDNFIFSVNLHQNGLCNTNTHLSLIDKYGQLLLMCQGVCFDFSGG